MRNFIAALKRRLQTVPAVPSFPDELIWLPDHQGEDYLIVLARLHKILTPATYLEIGSRTGDSLALASCASIAVDPQFRLSPAFLSNKPECHLYAMTSDDYFASHSPAKTFNRPIDFAFLDGLHHAEFLLRDFINAEAHCTPESVIALHDCFPLDAVMARRDQADRSLRDHPNRSDWWTGDVWLMAEALKKFRPDLTIIGLNAPPTGLLLVTDLNPGSTVLQDRSTEITAGFHTGSDPRQRYRSFAASMKMTHTRDVLSRADFISFRQAVQPV
jgi:hypothetical protein